jgi:hypothetical protein
MSGGCATTISGEGTPLKYNSAEHTKVHFGERGARVNKTWYDVVEGEVDTYVIINLEPYLVIHVVNGKKGMSVIRLRLQQ